jgi:uncharacterized glyoxalase superfamily protein PhnB
MTLAISLMLAVPSAQAAADWYGQALHATRLWDLGSVVGLEIEGAPFFLHEPTISFDSPETLGATTVRVEVLTNDPDAFIARALAAGAQGSLSDIRDHEVSWGVHRQGGFTDPFGHRWLVGDRSPLERWPRG